MKKKMYIFGLAGMLSLVGITPAFAGSSVPEIETLKQQMQQIIQENQNLRSRVSQLEEERQKVGEATISDKVLEDKIHKVYEQRMEDEDFAHKINKYVEFSGLIEVEASAADDFEGADSSGFELATVELGFDAQVTDWAKGHVLVLYEEGGDDDVVIDEGYITLGNTEKFPLYLNAGRLYVPFGNFETNMISDPLTLEIAETQETALQVGFEAAGAYGSVFAFNGDTNEGGGDSQIEQFGANIGYTLEQEGFSVDVGMSYMNSIGDSDGLSGILEEEDMLEVDYVGGIGAYVIAHIGPVELIGEYITALDDFDDADDSQPMAFNAEAGYTFDIKGMESTVAVAYQGTDDMAGNLPESRILASFGIGIFEGTTLAFEYAHDEDYDEADGGTDESADTFTAQLAYEF
ncbi:MAG TPA: LbtU family siderophore porin [Desulfobulbus sp.]|nr:LbtU family siderophore porin [Desulfobulbus sp.]